MFLRYNELFKAIYFDHQGRMTVRREKNTQSKSADSTTNNIKNQYQQFPSELSHTHYTYMQIRQFANKVLSTEFLKMDLDTI